MGCATTSCWQLRAGTVVTDEQLAAAASQGDREAYATLVDRYRRAAVGFAFGLTGRRDDAEDLAQEAFVRAYTALDRFRSSERWAPWFFRILRNACTDAARRRKSRGTEELTEFLPDPAPSPHDTFAMEQMDQALADAVAELPEEFRVVIVMHYGAGLTYREAAMALGIRESTVVGRIAGGLRRLRKQIRKEDWVG